MIRERERLAKETEEFLAKEIDEKIFKVNEDLFMIKEELLREVKKLKRERGDLNVEMDNIRNKLMLSEIRLLGHERDLESTKFFAGFTDLLF